MNQSEANKALIRAHYDSTANAYRPSMIDRQVATDFVDHAQPDAIGPECVKAQARTLRAAFPDLTVTIEDLVAEGDLVAVRALLKQGADASQARANGSREPADVAVAPEPRDQAHSTVIRRRQV